MANRRRVTARTPNRLLAFPLYRRGDRAVRFHVGGVDEHLGWRTTGTRPRTAPTKNPACLDRHRRGSRI
jgi:hypothetical protein